MHGQEIQKNNLCVIVFIRIQQNVTTHGHTMSQLLKDAKTGSEMTIQWADDRLVKQYRHIGHLVITRKGQIGDNLVLFDVKYHVITARTKRWPYFFN